jgi:hypothetical protein
MTQRTPLSFAQSAISVSSESYISIVIALCREGRSITISAVPD